MNVDNRTGVYIGPRNDEFKQFIISLLNRGNLQKKYIDSLTSEKSMSVYSEAFTSEFVDKHNNYQVYEQMGDMTANKFIVWYVYRRFPQLNCEEGLGIVTKIRHIYGSKDMMAKMARSLNFWPFISAPNKLRLISDSSLLEDTFESFLGATELLLDDNFKCVGVGYAAVYKILTSIFDEIGIDMSYENLIDAKSRLKELFDLFRTQLGKPFYANVDEIDEATGKPLYKSYVFARDYDHSQLKSMMNEDAVPINMRYHNNLFIGYGQGYTKKDAQIQASEMALSNLTRQKFVKEPPRIYNLLNQNKSLKQPVNRTTILYRIDNDEKKINELIRPRSKFMYKADYQYTAPILTHYAHRRNLEGIEEALKLGADPNVQDSDNTTAIDRLLMGKTEGVVVKALLLMQKYTNSHLNVHKNIYDHYWKKYQDVEKLKPFLKKIKIHIL